MGEDLTRLFGQGVEVLVMLIIGGFSAAIAYAHKVKDSSSFSVFRFFVHVSGGVMIAFLADNLIAWLIPDYNVNMEMLFIGVASAVSTKILETIDQNGIGILTKIIKR